MLGEFDDDFDVCSKDEGLEAYYKEQNGPENESIYQFYSRSYGKLCSRIISPDRFQYKSSDLFVEGYLHEEYDVYARGRTLHMCHWQPKVVTDIGEVANATKEADDPICILYFHTNLRSIVDSKEVFPVARNFSTPAHVLSFDLPGCGRSEGQLGGHLDLDIEVVLDWVQALIAPNTRIILWGRGMSTAPTISLLARFSKNEASNLAVSTASSFMRRSISNKNAAGQPDSKKTLSHYHIVMAVLDSPFTSIEAMVQHGLEQFQGRGFSFTKTLLNFLINRTLSHISSQLQGFDLFAVRPTDEVGDIACPVCIISAANDDYVPIQQGQEIAAKWAARVSQSHRRGSLVQFRIFDELCKHFDQRPAAVVQLTSDMLQRHVSLDAAVSTVCSQEVVHNNPLLQSLARRSFSSSDGDDDSDNDDDEDEDKGEKDNEKITSQKQTKRAAVKQVDDPNDDHLMSYEVRMVELEDFDFDEDVRSSLTAKTDSTYNSHNVSPARPLFSSSLSGLAASLSQTSLASLHATAIHGGGGDMTVPLTAAASDAMTHMEN